MIQVVACPHPLRADRHIFEAQPGASVEDLVVEAAERGNVPLSGMANAIVVIGDRIVPKNRWRHVRPKAGTVAIKAVPAAAPLPADCESVGAQAHELILTSGECPTFRPYTPRPECPRMYSLARELSQPNG